MTTPQKKNPVGPTGETVADNIKRLRGDTQYVKLAARLEEIGRPIPTLGLRKIESYERRVDADDLVALAVALDVSPVTLLVPFDSETKDDTVAVTGVANQVTASEAWDWMRAEHPLNNDVSASELLSFVARAAPIWRVRQYASGVKAILELNRVERDMESPDPVVAAAARARLDEMWKERQDGDD